MSLKEGDIYNDKKKKVRSKELVHGLVILTPLKDYDFAYLLAALRAYEQKAVRNENTHAIFWARHLRTKLRRYFGMLVRETKRENHRLQEFPLIIPLDQD